MKRTGKRYRAASVTMRNSLVYIFGLLLLLVAGCSNYDGSPIESTADQLEIVSGVSSFTVGESAYVGLQVVDGTDQYEWSMSCSDGIVAGAFSLSSSNADATLTYGGLPTDTGDITVTVKDGTGRTASKVISVLAGAALALELNENYPSGLDNFEAGEAGYAAFVAEGGTVPYEWRVSYSSGLVAEEFSFASSNAAATLTYDGGDTGSGSIIVTVEDNAGTEVSKIIAVVGPGYMAALEMDPETVDVGGEVVCVFHLAYKSNLGPVTDSDVTFEIVQGPAVFVDADGSDLGTTTNGAGPTDANGCALARIRAGDVEATTSVVVTAMTDTGAAATGSFTIERNLGSIEFFPGPEHAYTGSVYSVTYPYEGGVPAEADYIIPFSVAHTDGNGNPLANEEIVLDLYLKSDSIRSITLGDADGLSLPETLTTDDDGRSDFVLYVTVGTEALAAYDNIGSLVLTGETANGVRGSTAIVFRITESIPDEPLRIHPFSVWLVDGQPAAFSATGGSSPYLWTLSGGGSLSAYEGEGVVYTAPIPAVNAMVTVTDASGNSDSAFIWVWD